MTAIGNFASGCIYEMRDSEGFAFHNRLAVFISSAYNEKSDGASPSALKNIAMPAGEDAHEVRNEGICDRCSRTAGIRCGS